MIAGSTETADLIARVAVAIQKAGADHLGPVDDVQQAFIKILQRQSREVAELKVELDAARVRGAVNVARLRRVADAASDLLESAQGIQHLHMDTPFLSANDIIAALGDVIEKTREPSP